MFPAVFCCLKTDKGIFKTFWISSEWGNNAHFITKTPHQRKGLISHFWVTLEQDSVPCCICLTQGTWVDSRATQWGYLPRVTQVLSLNDLGILCPENLLLYIILVTFSSVTHLSTLGRGWHVAGFMGGVLPVLGSALMCCNSLHSH